MLDSFRDNLCIVVLAQWFVLSSQTNVLEKVWRNHIQEGGDRVAHVVSMTCFIFISLRGLFCGGMQIESASELLLVRRWLTLMQKHYRLYNVDYSHQCLTGMGMSESAKRSAIVRVFPGVDNFFGCVQCGQYHICRKSPNTCYVVNDHQQQRLFCLYSGHLLEHCENYETRPLSFQNDNSVPLQGDDRQYNTGTSFAVFGAQNSLYTNMKKGSTEEWERKSKPNTEKEEKEWDHVEKKPPTPVSKLSRVEDVVEEVEFSSCEDDEGGGGGGENHPLAKMANRDYNYQYWSEYYSFLWEKNAPRLSVPVTTRVKTKPPLFSHQLGNNGTEIEKECNNLIERLLVLSCSGGQKEPIFLLLTEYFVPLVKNFYLLIHNSPVVLGVAQDRRNNKAGKKPPVMTPKQVSEAVLLHLLIEPYFVEDVCKNRIQLWVRNPWLVHLSENNYIEEYYTKHLNKNGNTMERASDTKNDIRECLSVYFTHSHWLQNFIHTNRIYNNFC